jgi:hypothetical protein
MKVAEAVCRRSLLANRLVHRKASDSELPRSFRSAAQDVRDGIESCSIAILEACRMHLLSFRRRIYAPH